LLNVVLFFLCVYSQQIRRRLLLGQFHVEEDNHAGDVVHDALFFPLPPQVALLYDCFSGLLCVLRIEEGLDNLGDLVV